ncbi:MAG: dihydropteroate synthase [Deltaproteobacteria bacterium]|nr:dihydropteroate synthase [Deltaproteobacteria bacterium]
MTGTRCQIMGIVNVTPDSFYTGNRFASAEAAIDAACRMVDDGADRLDIGGESSRPGGVAVSATEELRRVIPVVDGVHARYPAMPLSIDTTKAVVAQEAIAAGATMVNDITAGRGDPAMMPVVATHGVSYLLMHMQGTPQTMQQAPHYDDVEREVGDFLAARLRAATAAGIDPSRCYLDPGIGFGKRPDDNLRLLKALPRLIAGPTQWVLGVSRKSIIGFLLGGVAVEGRLEGSLALVAWGAWHGIAIVRVHDVAETRRFLTVWDAVASGG